MASVQIVALLAGGGDLQRHAADSDQRNPETRPDRPEIREQLRQLLRLRRSHQVELRRHFAEQQVADRTADQPGGKAVLPQPQRGGNRRVEARFMKLEFPFQPTHSAPYFTL